MASAKVQTNLGNLDRLRLKMFKRLDMVVHPVSQHSAGRAGESSEGRGFILHSEFQAIQNYVEKPYLKIRVEGMAEDIA